MIESYDQIRFERDELLRVVEALFEHVAFKKVGKPFKAEGRLRDAMTKFKKIYSPPPKTKKKKRRLRSV